MQKHTDYKFKITVNFSTPALNNMSNIAHVRFAPMKYEALTYPTRRQAGLRSGNITAEGQRPCRIYNLRALSSTDRLNCPGIDCEVRGVPKLNTFNERKCFVFGGGLYQESCYHAAPEK